LEGGGESRQVELGGEEKRAGVDGEGDGGVGRLCYGFFEEVGVVRAVEGDAVGGDALTFLFLPLLLLPLSLFSSFHLYILLNLIFPLLDGGVFGFDGE
jgi:hypothetical protein